jgi:predicted anti-sigma-YlaC factor YlaD
MDCRDVIEILDAYALGAAEKTEARAMEEHVADCVRCWEELTKAQKAAALLALAVPMQQVPDHLERRIMELAAREKEQEGKRSLLERLRIGWPATATAASFAAVIALVFTGFQWMQMTDLRNEKNALEEHVRIADQEIEQTRQVAAVLSAPDTKKATIAAASMMVGATVIYNWSTSQGRGFIVCQNMPPLGEDQVYQVWFTADGRAYSSISFVTEDGSCLEPLDLSVVHGRPEGIGISIESAAGSSSRPSTGWAMFTSFTD